MTNKKIVFLILIFGTLVVTSYFLSKRSETQVMNAPKLIPQEKTSSSVEVLQKMRMENKLSQASVSAAVVVTPVNENEAEAQMEYFDKKEEE